MNWKVRAICIFVISSSLIMACGEKTDDLVVRNLQHAPLTASDIFLTVLNDSALADGTGYNVVKIKATPAVTSQSREVVFDISPFGKFSNGSSTQSVILDVNGEGQVYAVSNTPGVVMVKATIANASVHTPIQFVTAWPDQLIIETDSVFLQASPGSKTSVKATLVRNTGSPTSGQLVHFYDSTSNGGSVGLFSGTSGSNQSGVARSEYWLQDTSYRGYVYIKGYVNTPGGRILGVSRIFVR